MECLPAFLPSSDGTYIWHIRKRFYYLLAPNEKTEACFGNARSLADTSCELVSLNTGRSVAKGEESERNTQNFAVPTPRFARKFSTWNLPSHAGGACPQNCMVEQPRSQVSEMNFVEFLNPSTFQSWKTSFKPRCVLVHNFVRKLCCGSKKWRFYGRS